MTLILEGVKLSEVLSPTPRGRITWNVPGWVDVEVVEELVTVVLDVRVVVDEEDVVEVRVVDVDGEDVVVEGVDADVLEVIEARDPAEEDVEVLVWVLECSVVVEEGWKRTLVANAPATRTSVRPAMTTTVPSRPTKPRGPLSDILSLVLGRWRVLFCLPLHHGELREA
jgi:hypothetical protein